MNASWMDTFVRRYHQVDINLVMGAGSFLATPVLRNVGAKGLSAISAEIAGLEDSLFAQESAQADDERLAIGTFSIHNLGEPICRLSGLTDGITDYLSVCLCVQASTESSPRRPSCSPRSLALCHWVSDCFLH